MSVRVMAHVWDIAEIEGTELLVMLALADFCNDEGWCWPSVETLARKARLSARGVRGIIRRLEEKGFIECPAKTGGRGYPNRYRVRPQARKKAEPERRNDVPPSAVKAEPGRIKAERAGAAEPSKNRQIDSSESIISSFAKFWHAYPRKVSKQAAERKFRTAVKAGAEPQSIIAGAERYAAHITTNGIDPAFVKHPDTWLNKGCWDDELPHLLTTKRTPDDRLARKMAVAAGFDQRAETDGEMADGADRGEPEPLLPARIGDRR